MATLWIREYERVGSAGGAPSSAQNFGYSISHASIPQEPGTDQSPLTYSASQQSAAFGEDARFIAIISDAAFHYVVGSDPTATTNALKVPADTLIHLGVTAGQKIAAIAAA